MSRAALIACLATVGLAAAAPARANPIDPTAVPAEASLVAGVDLQAVHRSALWPLVEAELRKSKSDAKVMEAASKVFFNAARDVTFWATDFEDKDRMGMVIRLTPMSRTSSASEAMRSPGRQSPDWIRAEIIRLIWL